MTEQKNTPQEIDLIELFGNIWNWFTKIYLGVLYFFLRNILLFILAIFISIIAGYTITKISKPFYKSELFAFSHTISNIETIQAINNWNYPNEFTEDELEDIKGISAQYLLDLNGDGVWDMVEEGKADEVTDTALINKRIYRAFCIRVELYDTTLVNSIKLKVFSHLENNNRVKEINEIRLRQQKELIPKLRKEINDLDSLKKLQYFKDLSNSGKAGDLMILNEKDLQLFHGDIIKLYKEQQKIERDLFLSSEPFEIIQDFSIPRFQENSLINILIKSLKVGLVLGFLIILALDRRKQIIDLIRNSKNK